MKLIVGLGNPGIEYQFTPHNIGFLVLDRLAERNGIRIANRHCHAQTGRGKFGQHEVLLAKPETFMNLSGQAVSELVAEYQIEASQDLIVVYDELDLPLGGMRIRARGSSAGHKGMQNILGALGTREIQRVRLGIDPGHEVNAKQYVLRQIKRSEYALYDEILDRGAEAVEAMVSEGVAAAMNRFNRKPEKEEPAEE